jgi:hypothetical protein
MSLFKEHTNEMAFLKMGFFGRAGAGKTHTASRVALGLVKLLREKGLPQAERPVLFLDSEQGSDFEKPMFTREGIQFLQHKSRSFEDLVAAIKEAERSGSVLIVDSVSHFWTELCDSYQAKLKRSFLKFQDWAVIKKKWARFTDAFVNSQAHVILCGRQGDEYEEFENEKGKKEQRKSGIRMKSEKETGYEPNLLVLMEREESPDGKQVARYAYVLKDRSKVLDGKSFKNPTFREFKPHIDFLALGAVHRGFDAERNSQSIFTDEDKEAAGAGELVESKKLMKEIGNALKERFPDSLDDCKPRRQRLIEEVFGVLSFGALQNLEADTLRAGLVTLREEVANGL